MLRFSLLLQFTLEIHFFWPLAVLLLCCWSKDLASMVVVHACGRTNIVCQSLLFDYRFFSVCFKVTCCFCSYYLNRKTNLIDMCMVRCLSHSIEKTFFFSLQGCLHPSKGHQWCRKKRKNNNDWKETPTVVLFFSKNERL